MSSARNRKADRSVKPRVEWCLSLFIAPANLIDAIGEKKMIDEPNADVALLTPVPAEHLISGLEICAQHRFVAFGSDAGLALAEFRHRIGEDGTADILFYASGASVAGVPKATYRGRFVRYEGAKANGKPPPSLAAFRPPTTSSDGPWQGFYVVSGLHKLATPIELRTLSKLEAKGKLVSSFVPRGPLIIDTPF